MTSKIILISGWGSNQNIWKTLQEKINADYHYFDWRLYLDDNSSLQLFLDKLKKVIIVGWSLGAVIALKGALLKPDKTKKLILLSPTARMTKDRNYSGVNKKTLAAMAGKLMTQKQELIDEFAANCFFPEPADRQFTKMSNCFAVSALKKGLDFLNDTDLRAELPKIKIPALIIHGSKDKIIPPAQSEYLHKALPASSFKKTKAGHALPFFLTTELLTDIESFINAPL